MEIKTDLHCHTIASTHAYSTIMELAQSAAAKGMEAIAMTDHGIALPDAPHMWHFENLRSLPAYMHGIRILKGCEANIVDPAGTLDMPERLLKRFDIVVASIHAPSYGGEPGGDHTAAYMAAVENPYVDIIGHSGNPNYRYDYDKVLLKAKELHKLIEINDHSFVVRQENVALCRMIALKCKEYGVHITVDSDAHFCGDVGDYTRAETMLREIDFPEEFIANRSLTALKEYLQPRKIIE